MLFFISVEKIAYVLNTAKTKLPAEPTETQSKDYQYCAKDDFFV